MKSVYQIIHPILQHPFYSLFVFWIIFKYNDAKQILSDDKGLSSRRVVALLAANNLFNSISYCVHNNQDFDPYIGWTLVVLCIFCLGMVMFPEILTLLDKLSSLKSNVTTKKTETNIKEEKTEVK